MLTIRHFLFNSYQENTYVIFDEMGECLIVDPGCYFENEHKELTDFLDTNNLTPKCLLNTHCHPDHVFGNRFVATRYGLALHIHEAEKPVLDNAPLFGAKWGTPFENYTGRLILLKEGNAIALGGYRFEILFTPGHSPGSVCFYCREENAVIGGDVLFRQSIGRTDLPGGNYQTLITSIRTQLLVLPDETVVYPGHGPSTSIGYEKAHNPFLV